MVAGVQEGSWPDVRRRGSLLEPDRLGRRQVNAPVPTATRIAEERRLFYVACTRARSRLVVTAVAGTEGEGDQPSRFLLSSAYRCTSSPGRPRRPLSLAGSGRLSCAGQRRSRDLAAAPGAGRRPARAAGRRDRCRRPAARARLRDPTHWWGMRPLTRADRPVVPPGQPVHLSGSQLGDGVWPARGSGSWPGRPRASPRAAAAASFGSVVHVLAEHGAQQSRRPRRALRPSGVGLGPARLRRATGCPRWSGSRRSPPWSVSSTWQEARPHLELLGHRGAVLVRGRPGRRSGPADGQRRPGRAGAGRPDPDRGLQDLTTRTDGGRRRAARPARRLPAGGPAGRLRRGGRGGCAAGGRGAGLPAAAGRPSSVSRRSSSRPRWTTCRSRSAARRARIRRGPDQPTWVHRRLAEAAEIIRTERHDARLGAGCRYCPFRSSCPAQPAGRQVVA